MGASWPPHWMGPAPRAVGHSWGGSCWRQGETEGLWSEGMDAAGEGRICPGAGCAEPNPSSSGLGTEMGLVGRGGPGPETPGWSESISPRCSRLWRGHFTPLRTPQCQGPSPKPGRVPPKWKFSSFIFALNELGTAPSLPAHSGNSAETLHLPSKASPTNLKKGPRASPSLHQAFCQHCQPRLAPSSASCNVWAQMEMLLEPLRDRELG